VPTIPRSSTSAPPSTAPSIAEAVIEGEERRMSRPIAIRFVPKCVTYARAIA
jgi:hypothetical protein